MRITCTILTVLEKILVVHSYIQTPQRWGGCFIQTSGPLWHPHDEYTTSEVWHEGEQAITMECCTLYVSLHFQSIRRGWKLNLPQSKDCIAPNGDRLTTTFQMSARVKKKIESATCTLIMQLCKTHLEFMGYRLFDVEFRTLRYSD